MDINLNDLNVLIVEPSKTQQRIIERELNSLSIDKIDAVHTAQEALNYISTGAPDLILSAYYLSDMTGNELLHTLREDATNQGTCFVLVSSVTDIRQLDAIRQAGVVAILPKPFSAKDLSLALKTTLSHLNPEDIALENTDIDDLKILLVDDSKLARKHIRRTLTSMGLENVIEAENGREAVGILNSELFDLIVTDYNMPEMDGRELSAYIREQSDQASVPIIMVTSEQNDSRLAAVQQAGVSAICDKPFEPENVRQLIQQLIN
ncbi:MAG: two-component system response regulator [Cycloclasticus sp. symbiont of Bathymodiolus heckerae]|nr:MAG: two-component system response regulator [Cycloclasticus sp. symbiont of Bathymodiolus heckerae]